MASIKKDIETQVFALIATTVEEVGVELLETKFLQESGRWFLRIIIDKRGGVSLDDCERVSRAINPLIDENIDIKQAYYLEVQSPGIDRPLKTKADFERYKGSTVELSFYKAQEGQKKIEGTLLAGSDTSITIEVNDEEKEYQLNDISKVKRVIEF